MERERRPETFVKRARRFAERRPLATAVLLGLVCFAALRTAGACFPLVSQAEYSRAVYDRKGRLLRLALAPDGMRRLPVDVDALPQHTVAALLLQEDRWYYWHPGVNPIALLRALRGYLGGTDAGGASTLSMQTARLRFRLDTRKPQGKLLQIIAALWLEGLYSKDHLLGAYLTLAPFGRNVEGLEAASRIYFQKRAAQLTLPESLLLACIPKSPTRRAPGAVDNAELRAARDRLQKRWLARYPDDQSAESALADVSVRLALPPFRAPHWTHLLLEKSDAPIIESTLDLELQTLLETQAELHLQMVRREGVENTAAILLDYRSMTALAYLGSAGFRNDAIQGQVNGVRAKRSPGSTLKPLLYALAFDQGLIHPHTLLKDSPTSFGLFAPENFDRDFSGPVFADEALIRSRNVPAVYLAARVTQPSLYDLLERAGVRRLKPPAHYQLALALGGAELTMEELAVLYGALARGGETAPLERCTRGCDADEGAPARLFSEAAAFLTLDALKDNPRPDRGAVAGDLAERPIYWKTGTSMGFRDAWSAGIFDDYVLIVWAGDFSGASNPFFSGRDAAAPLFFRIVDALRARSPGRPPGPRAARPPESVARVQVCAVSGDLPGEHCPHQTDVWFIPGVSPIARCSIHRAALVDPQSGLRVCGPTARVKSEVFEFWPSDLMELYAQAGAPRAAPPEFAPECRVASQDGLSPQITSPVESASLQLFGARTDRRLALSAVADGGVRKLYWFADDAYLGESEPTKSFFWNARPGAYLLRVVDDHGRTDSMELTISPDGNVRR